MQGSRILLVLNDGTNIKLEIVRIRLASSDIISLCKSRFQFFAFPGRSMMASLRVVRGKAAVPLLFGLADCVALWRA
ncbi:hypothetical protein HYPGJ_30220 [Hyphomicrobium sp. GJ21]|nr:hypothetical protein HYPGJ_30220 [Hyphomicrobium sp. GJ21]